MQLKVKFQAGLSRCQAYGLPDPVYVQELEKHLRTLDALERKASTRSVTDDSGRGEAVKVDSARERVHDWLRGELFWRTEVLVY